MRTMKHFLSLLLLLVINIHAYASDDGVIRILAIGNSFSQDAIENYLHQLAEASGKQTIIANMYIGGCTLERHYNNAQNNTAAYSYRKIGVDGMKVSKEGVTLETALKDEKWDYVTNYFDFQESLERLFGRKVDLVVEKGLKNKYFIANVNRTKQIIYG